MAIQYAGGTIVDTTFTGDTKAAIITAIETHLTTAGWTVISGAGTTDVLLESATVPTSLLKGRVRVTQATNCATIAIKNSGGTRESTGLGHLLPAASKTFRIIANKYQFFCFTPGSSVAREYVWCAAAMYIPTFLNTVITENLAFASNSDSDTSTTLKTSWRTNLGDGAPGNWAAIVNDTLIQRVNINATHFNADIQLIAHAGAKWTLPQNSYRWHDDTLMIYEPLVSLGLASTSDEAKVRGQLFDAIVLSDSYAADSTISFDGHTWRAITGGNVGTVSAAPRGTLFVAIT